MTTASTERRTRRKGFTLSRVRVLAVLPMLTAVAAMVCALWAPARRFSWLLVALAAVNVIMTPLTSGEWFYQRAEDASYQQSVAKGDFGAFDRLLGQHDPHLQPRMIAMAVVLLIALVGLAVLHGASRGKGAHRPTALARAAIVGVLLAATVTLVQGGLLLFG